MDMLNKPNPLISTDADRVFWNGIRNQKILISHCKACNQHSHPRIKCHCAASPLEWVEAVGTGEVYTYVIYHRAYHPGFAEEVPYNVSWIQLDEGVLLMSNIVDCALSDITIGMRVNVCYEEQNGIILPKFKPIPTDQ